MVDFVEEVEEQLRAERYAMLAKRLWPWLVSALAALIVGWLGVWGYNVWQDRNIAAASVVYEKGLSSLMAGDQTGAYNTFDSVAKTGPAGYRALALIQQGDIRALADKSADAAALYDAAAKVAPNPIFGDLARLRAAMALMDSTPYPQIKARLDPLIGEKKPYTLEAREALAMAKLQAGMSREARNDLNGLTLTLGVSQDMRGRVQNAIAIIDSGQTQAADEAVRVAATMPPPDPASLAGLLGAPAGPSAGSQTAAPPSTSQDASGPAQ